MGRGITLQAENARAAKLSPHALEEGLDVPECQVVIRFDKFATAKSRIQGAD